MKKTKYKAIFISDCHLASTGCKGKKLLEFLKTVECEHLFLIGDIFDFWRLDRRKWDKHQTEVVRRLLKISKHCTVHYVLGNHDHCMMEFLDSFHYPNLEICKETSYETGGKRYLISHGDKFDLVLATNMGTIVAKIGSWGYELLIDVNEVVAKVLRIFGIRRVSISKFVKERVKRAVSFIANFEHLMAEYAKEEGYQGIFCGHVHYPAIKDIEGVEYYNCGDWVENCSAIVEKEEGIFELVSFAD